MGNNNQSTNTTAKSTIIRLLTRAVSHFLRMNIVVKMLFGYIPLFILLLLISAFALASLNRLNVLNESILKTDIPVREASSKMIDALLAQELFLQRYLILKTPELLNLYQERSAEFSQMINKIDELPEDRQFPITELTRTHDEYNSLLINGLDILADPTSSKAKEYEQTIKKKQESLVKLIQDMATAALKDQNEKTGVTATIGALAFRVATVLCVVGLIFSVAAATIVTRNIAGAIKKLHLATLKISEGDFDYVPNIKNKDELGDLSDAFVMMAKRLKALEEMYRDASPLTMLPGGVAIENILKKKIQQFQPIAFCLMDLDNFKSYNDNYGYAMGNEIIQATASYIEKAVAEFGTEDDFIGHIGGDDFVLITSHDRYEKICRAVIKYFDDNAPDFYNEQDRKRGCIVAENRQGEKMTFPLASISIAVVTNQRRVFASHIQVGEIAADLKEFAKSQAGSALVVDKRHDSPEVSPKILKFSDKING
ncbi:MAG: diguanylate cyclase [Proteobacteria bacterium]|nr:diguanylate cyclase [Pseudomonadota bacterium]MBU1716028.1 diguanylate cyclase [Pseudomonadota bacterium]